jgi:Na+/proline symporter
MAGMVVAAIYIVNLPEVGGLSKMLAHPNVVGKLNFLPDFSDSSQLIPLFLMPLAVQWWSVWYPGAEPGGGGYIAQRMLSAKDEKNAVTATLFFNIAHYALRPWPWILIALASLIVFPDIASLQAAFPHIDPKVVKNDLAFSAMLNLLPAGLIGLLIAALLSAFMSTISTHLNWGSSYVVNDFYKRFIRPDAPQNELVNVGRISTVVLMILAALLALVLENALQAFNILLQIGAGTGLIFILRWFWWRINAYSEITAMFVSFFLALYFELGVENPMPEHIKLITGVAITTASWILVTLVTAPASQETLLRFFRLIQPAPGGWKPVIEKGIASGELNTNEIVPGKLPNQILGMFLGCVIVYAALFATGYWIYGNTIPAIISSLLALLGGYLMLKNWDKIY